MVPWDEVWLVGVEHRHWSSGNAPPTARENRIEWPWSMAAVQAAVPTRLSLTL